jgi:hypothetical protein
VDQEAEKRRLAEQLGYETSRTSRIYFKVFNGIRGLTLEWRREAPGVHPPIVEFHVPDEHIGELAKEALLRAARQDQLNPDLWTLMDDIIRNFRRKDDPHG